MVESAHDKWRKAMENGKILDQAPVVSQGRSGTSVPAGGRIGEFNASSDNTILVGDDTAHTVWKETNTVDKASTDKPFAL